MPVYPKVKEPVFNQNQSNTSNQKISQNVPQNSNQKNQQQNNIPNLAGEFKNQAQNFMAAGNAVNNYQNAVLFNQHPDLCHLVDVPLFPREIWPALSQIVTNAVA